MRKIFLFLLIFLLLISFTGCEVKVKTLNSTPTSKTYEELIKEENYLEAYKTLLGKDDDFSKTELKKFVFLPEETVMTDEIGVQTNGYYTWDKDGKPLEFVIVSNKKIDITTYAYGVGKYSIHENGDLSKVYVLDDDGNIVSIDDCYSAPSYVSNLKYDDGKLIEITIREANGDIVSTTKYIYDENDMLIKEKRSFPSVDLSYETVYEYNANGQNTTRTEEEKNSKGKKSIYSKHIFKYDKGEKPISMVEKYYDKDGKESVYEYDWSYDEYGNLTKEVCTYNNGGTKDVITIEHKNYNIFYVPDKHPVLDETLKIFKPYEIYDIL